MTPAIATAVQQLLAALVYIVICLGVPVVVVKLNGFLAGLKDKQIQGFAYTVLVAIEHATNIPADKYARFVQLVTDRYPALKPLHLEVLFGAALGQYKAELAAHPILLPDGATVQQIDPELEAKLAEAARAIADETARATITHVLASAVTAPTDHPVAVQIPSTN